MKVVVTTAIRPTRQMLDWAAWFATQLHTAFVPRKGRSLASIQASCGASTVVVVTAHGPVVYCQGEKMFFHINMAQLRIKNLKSGKHDHMVNSCALQPGDTVLDCTLGLAADATVASFVVGDSGMVVGLESSPLLAALAAFGVRHYQAEDPQVTQALRRLTVISTAYEEYLPSLPDNSFDVVYFDPMFRRPLLKSVSLYPVRLFADSRAIPPQAITEACRVARRRVVIKETTGSSEFARLKVHTVLGGKYSPVQYGVIFTGDIA